MTHNLYTWPSLMSIIGHKLSNWSPERSAKWRASHFNRFRIMGEKPRGSHRIPRRWRANIEYSQESGKLGVALIWLFSCPWCTVTVGIGKGKTWCWSSWLSMLRLVSLTLVIIPNYLTSWCAILVGGVHTPIIRQAGKSLLHISRKLPNGLKYCINERTSCMAGVTPGLQLLVTWCSLELVVLI